MRAARLVLRPSRMLSCAGTSNQRRRHEVRQHSRHRGQHAACAHQPARARAREPLRQDRGVQSARLGEGSPRARRDRGGGEIRRAQARPDRDRGDLGQHRHRACDGVRRQGLSVRLHHGGTVQRRAAQADAFPRRQGGDHARGRTRLRHGRESAGACEEERLVPDAPVRERGQSRHAFAHHGARDHRRLQGQARLLGHRLRHRRHAERRRARVREGNAQHQDRAVRAGRSADAHQRPAAGAQPGRHAGEAASRHSSRIRCRAGARISSRSSPAMRST